MNFLHKLLNNQIKINKIKKMKQIKKIKKINLILN